MSVIKYRFESRDYPELGEIGTTRKVVMLLSDGVGWVDHWRPRDQGRSPCWDDPEYQIGHPYDFDYKLDTKEYSPRLEFFRLWLAKKIVELETKEQCHNTVSRGETEGTHIMDAIKTVREAAIIGAKTAAIDEASTALLEVARTLLGDAAPAVLATPLGQAASKVLAAFALLALQDVVNFGLDRRTLQSICEIQIEASTRDALQPHLAQLRTALEPLQALRALKKGGAE